MFADLSMIKVSDYRGNKLLQLEFILRTGWSTEEISEFIGNSHGNTYIINCLDQPATDAYLRYDVMSWNAVYELYSITKACLEGSPHNTLKSFKKMINGNLNRHYIRTVCDFTPPANEKLDWIGNISPQITLQVIKVIQEGIRQSPVRDFFLWGEWIRNQLTLESEVTPEDEEENIPTDSVFYDIKEPPPPIVGDLRDYQEEAIHSITTAISQYERTHGLLVLRLPTGSGKTRTAAEFLMRYLQEDEDRWVVWLAPNWILIDQAVAAVWGVMGGPQDLRRTASIPKHTKYFSQLLDGNQDESGRIVFSTLHTWNKQYKLWSRPTLFILDEAHWGFNAKMFRNLYKFANHHRLKNPVPILGMTATPKNPDTADRSLTTVYAKSYAELEQQGVLATPIIINISTNYEWNPIIKQGMITAESLAKLDNEQRNRLIVDTLVKEIKHKTDAKVLVFACNIKNAENLTTMLGQANVSARVVHSGMCQQDILTSIESLREGRVGVLVNVMMLTQGFDVPEIDRIFLARPCESDVLLAQMIGRGSRRTDTKTSFRIYDFVDKLINTNMTNKIFHDINSLFSGRSIKIAPGTSREKNGYQAPDRPEFEILRGEDFGSLQGIDFVSNQSFGIELEITSSTGLPIYDDKLWSEGVSELIDVLKTAELEHSVHPNGLSYHESEEADATDQWRVEFDCSAGWEIISPPLIGITGLRELLKVCQALEGLLNGHEYFNINYRCGFHLTLATRLDTEDHLRELIGRVCRLEPGLFTLVAPSRLWKFDPAQGECLKSVYNQYCSPLSAPVNREKVEAMMNNPYDPYLEDIYDNQLFRYFSVNITKSKGSPHLVEIRLHNGTVDANKIIPWISLWMNIINRVAFDIQSGEISELDIFDLPCINANDENIFELLKMEEIPITTQLQIILHQRRKQLANRWRAILPDRVQQWESSEWY